MPSRLGSFFGAIDFGVWGSVPHVPGWVEGWTGPGTCPTDQRKMDDAPQNGIRNSARLIGPSQRAAIFESDLSQLREVHEDKLCGRLISTTTFHDITPEIAYL